LRRTIREDLLLQGRHTMAPCRRKGHVLLRVATVRDFPPRRYGLANSLRTLAVMVIKTPLLPAPKDLEDLGVSVLHVPHVGRDGNKKPQTSE
jgi:hypothetical protein